MTARSSGTSWSSTASSQARGGPTTARSWGPRIGTSTKMSIQGSTILRYDILNFYSFHNTFPFPGLSPAQGLQGVLDEPPRPVRGRLHRDGQPPVFAQLAYLQVLVWSNIYNHRNYFFTIKYSHVQGEEQELVWRNCIAHRKTQQNEALVPSNLGSLCNTNTKDPLILSFWWILILANLGNLAKFSWSREAPQIFRHRQSSQTDVWKL